MRLDAIWNPFEPCSMFLIKLLSLFLEYQFPSPPAEITGIAAPGCSLLALHSGLSFFFFYRSQSTFPRCASSSPPLDLFLGCRARLLRPFVFALRLCLTFGTGDIFSPFSRRLEHDRAHRQWWTRAAEQNMAVFEKEKGIKEVFLEIVHGGKD